MRGEVLRYLVAGVLAFATDLAVLYALTEWLGMHYLASNVFSYSCGLFVAYLLNTRWVFTYRRLEKKTRQEFMIFTAIALAGLAISEVILVIVAGQMAVHYVAAKFVATFFVMLFNFVARKRILFQPPASAEG